MFRFACVLLVLGTIAHGFPQDASSADSEREKDACAIYSLLLTNPKTSHGADNNERYLIAPTTVPGVPPVPCIRPPKEREGDFAEVLADYDRRRVTQQPLKAMFSIPKPYLLLTAEEVKAFMEERLWPKPSPKPPDERFRGVIDLFRLTDVYFNPPRTLALTQISTWCGGLCALWEWKVFEKLDTGKWEPRQWVTCGTMAKNLVPLFQHPRKFLAETSAMRRTSRGIAKISPSGSSAAITSGAKGMSCLGTGAYRSAMTVGTVSFEPMST